MLSAVIGLILLGLAGRAYVMNKRGGRGWSSLLHKDFSERSERLLGFAALGAGLFLIATRSFVIVGPDEVGHTKRVYLAADMKAGQVIALPGQKGPRSEILPPGFHFIPFIRVLNEVEFHPVVNIPKGQLGLLVARDGRPLRDGQFLADDWAQQDFENMLDATHFLSEGQGQKGPQLSVLKPGRYRLNHYLWEVKEARALDVPTGHVAVIRSNVETGLLEGATFRRMQQVTTQVEVPAQVDEQGKVTEQARTEDRVDVQLVEEIVSECPDVIRSAGGGTGAAVAAAVVPKGCIGVWDEPLPPGKYYLNPDAYVPTIIPTRLQTWTYKGGYESRRINLTVSDEGKIIQSEHSTEVPMPESAADRAIMVRVEGWTVPVEMRVVAQVHPKDAPFVVASVGDLQKIEDSIVTPTIRDILRTIAGQKDRRVLDFIEARDEITAQVESVVAREAKKAGVTVQEARMGEPALPPELLVARLREQLATQLKETYTQERKAQEERIAKEQAKELADQQATLVQADIQRQAAEYRKEQLRLEGEGEKLRQMEIAQGQKAIANVLGPERTLQLQMLKEILEAALQQPDIIKVPQVNVSGGTSLEGGAAVLGTLLGNSNVAGAVNAQSGQKK